MSIKETIVAQSSKIGFVLKKHAPEIITGVGIVASVASTVLAVKETPKAMKITEDLKENLASVEEIKSKRDKDQNFVYSDGTKTSYTDKEVLSDKIHFYTIAAVGYAKTYWPAVVLGGVSIFCSIKGQQISLKRNAAIAAAYTAVDQAFKEYRERVKKAVGEEKEEDIYKGARSEKLKNEKTGKKETVKVVDSDAPVAPYGRWFDSSNPNFSTSDHEYNTSFVDGVQNYWNTKLRSEGHVFLNDVYRTLGFEDTKVGAVVGWLYKPTVDVDGDGYIDLRASINTTADLDSLNDGSIFIDPNVDGVIISALPEE